MVGNAISFDLTPITAPGRQLIDGYGDGGFVVDRVRYKGSVLVFPDRSLDWHVGGLADLTLPSLDAVIETASQIDILIIGCGPAFTVEPNGLRRGLRDHGIVLEWMDTGAACRTYNVLLAEDRRLAAALIAVD